MSKKITIYYTVNSYCIKEIEVPDDFEIKGRNAQIVFEELCKRLPEESLNDIEDEDGDHEVEITQFSKIDGVEVYDPIKRILEKFIKKKEVIKYK